VVAATHVELGEKVALKFLRPEALANEELVGRFAREARASAKIKSEYVARVFDVGNLEDGAPFIVMEHLDGKDLGGVLREQGALPIKLAVEYVLQACEALAAAHANGVVHRDIKPENLFLTQRAQGMDIIKVLDFGISKVALTGSAFESRYPMVQTMMAMGSPIYMSPEQIRASKDIDVRTDIWSLGCVLYELLTGNPAFDAPSLTQITATILEQDAPSLHLACPTAPPGLEALVKRCLAKDPALRFQNVAELAVALYPYGPRRGRVSAERCCFVLRSAGMSQADFELPSVFPPTFSSITTGMLTPSDVIPSTTTSVDTKPTMAAPAPASKKWPIVVAMLATVAVMYALFGYRGGNAAPPAETTSPAPTAPTTAAAIAPAAPVVTAPVPGSYDPGSPVAATASPAIKVVPAIAAAGAARPRVTAPAPKPRAAASARPSPTGAREADIGF
jgi:serine/threonine protein kinase